MKKRIILFGLFVVVLFVFSLYKISWSQSYQSYAPMLFKNKWGYDSALYVQNVGSSDANVAIGFYDADDGSLTCTTEDIITPLASKGYWLPDLTPPCTPAMPSSWYGAAVITSDEPVVAVGRPHLGTEITTYNGFLQGSTQVSAPMLFKNKWGYDSALYIQNVGSSDATVTIEFYDADTGSLTCTKRDRITPLASRGYWLPDMSCTPAMPSSWYGAAVITSDQDVVAVGRPHLGSEITTYNGFLMQGSMQGNSISGRVTDSQGTGIPDIDVEVYVDCEAWWYIDWISVAITDADGYYTVGGLPTGSYLVYFWAGDGDIVDANYVSEFYNDKIDCDSADMVPVTLTPTTYIDAILAPGGSISGKLTYEGGDPVVYGSVDVYDTNYNWINYSDTDENGDYTVGHLPTGSYKLWFFEYAWDLFNEWYNNKGGCSNADLVSVTAPNTTTGINAVLAAGNGSISGTVTYSGDLSYIYIDVYDTCGNWIKEAYPDWMTGDYTVTGLLTGSYKIDFYDYGSIDIWYNQKYDFDSADTIQVTEPDAITGIDADLD